MRDIKRKQELALAGGAILLFAAAIYVSREWPFETAMFPVVIGTAGLALAIVAVAGDLINRKQVNPVDAGAPEQEAQTPQYVTFLWIAGFFAAVMLFGYQWGLTAAAFAFYRFEARLSWAIAGLATVLCGGFLYIAMNVLNIPLYEGMLLELLP